MSNLLEEWWLILWPVCEGRNRSGGGEVWSGRSIHIRPDRFAWWSQFRMAVILKKEDLALHILHNERQLHAQTHTGLSLSLSFSHFLSLPHLFSLFLGLLSSTAPLPSHILTHTFSLPFSSACLPDNSIINWPIWPTLLINSSHQGSLLFFACCWAGITISWTTGDLQDWVIKKRPGNRVKIQTHTNYWRKWKKGILGVFL